MTNGLTMRDDWEVNPNNVWTNIGVPGGDAQVEAAILSVIDDLDASADLLVAESVFQAVRSSQIYLNEDVLSGSGYTAEQISRFILDYTEAQGTPDGSPPLPASEGGKRVFSAAFPITTLPDLPCMPEARSAS